MMKRFIGSVTALIVILSLMTLGASSAHAAEVTVGDGTWTPAGSKFTASSAVVLKGTSKVQLEYLGKVKLTKEEKTAKGCPLVSSFKAGQKKGTKCFRLKRGAKFTNSGRDRNGTIRYYDDYVGSPGSKTPKAKWMKFVVRGSHWVKAGDQAGAGNCANRSKPYKKGGLTHKSVQLFSSFSNVKWTIKGSLSESGELSAWAEAKCTNSGSSARVKAKGSYSVEVEVTVSAKTKAQAKLKGPGSISAKQRTDVIVEAKAKARMKIEAEASAWCKDTPSEPTPETEKPTVTAQAKACVKPGEASGVITGTVGSPNSTADTAVISIGSQSTEKSVSAGGTASFSFSGFAPGTYTVNVTLKNAKKSTSTTVVVEKCDVPPPAEPPVFVQFREFNDLEVNWKDDHCVTVDTPTGHTATVYWEAKFGSFTTPSKPAQDGVQVCSVYKAPSEVPASGTDTITVRAVDNVTGKSVTKATDPFVVNDTAPHPA